jgi:hypothetical protein
LTIKLGNVLARRNDCGGVNRGHFGDEIGNGQTAFGCPRFEQIGGLNIDFDLVDFDAHARSIGSFQSLVEKVARRVSLLFRMAVESAGRHHDAR